MADTLKLEFATPDAIVLSDKMAATAVDDAANVEEVRQRAQERLHEKLSPEEEMAPVQAALVRFAAEMNVKRRFAGRF